MNLQASLVPREKQVMINRANAHKYSFTSVNLLPPRENLLKIENAGTKKT
jgi:hypothetical protein